MKDNVDLTLNRDFRNKDINIQSLKKTLLNKLQKFPWSFTDNMLNTTTNYDELFFTGNREEREKKKEYDNYKNQTSCERCGKDLSKKRWDNYNGLCEKCISSLEKYLTPKDPWLEELYTKIRRK